jgi:serine protease inhibitor
MNALTMRWFSGLPSDSVAEGTALAGIGVWPLLAILAGAADGTARAELAAAISIEPERAARAAVEALEWLAATPGLTAATGVWHHPTVPIRDEWRDSLPPGTVETFSGDVAKDQAAVDEWAARSTNGRIPAMPVEISADTRMLLASAVSIMTKWKRPFFHDDGGWLARPTKNLNIVQCTDDVTCVRVKGDNGIDAILVIGAADAAPGAVLTAGLGVVDGTVAARSGADLTDGHVGPGITVTSTPSKKKRDICLIEVAAFTISVRHDLLAVGEALGLVAVTDRTRGHLPGISPVPLYVESGGQSLDVRFTAGGFDAVAITGLEQRIGGVRPMPKHRTLMIRTLFDRPFGFLAMHRKSGLVLATGWVKAKSQYER